MLIFRGDDIDGHGDGPDDVAMMFAAVVMVVRVLVRADNVDCDCGNGGCGVRDDVDRDGRNDDGSHINLLVLFVL